MRHVLSAFTLTLLACACASSGGSRDSLSARPVQVSFRDYRTHAVLTLVNESHSDRLAVYSQERRDASVKVTTDEIMDALLEYIERNDRYRLAQSGDAPLGGTDLIQSIEIQDGADKSHMVLFANLPSEQANSFRLSRDAFLQTYNNVYQAQAIESDPGEEIFTGPQYSKKRRN